MDDNKKYNTGRPNEKLPENEEERASVIRTWSEGNEHLENAITNCINNGIETWACCAGHHYIDFPYLSMKINEENKEKILSIMQALANMPGVTIDVSFMNRGAQGELLTITSNMKNRDKCFDAISKASRNPLKLEETNEIVQALWKLHSGLTSYQIEHDAEITNSRLKGRVLTIRPVSKNFSNVLDEFMKRHNIMQVYYKKSFLSISKLKELTENITNRAKEKFGKTYNGRNIMNEEEKQRLENLKKFFDSDELIKQTLIDIDPNQKDDYNSESRISYIDRIFQEAKSMEFEFLSVCRNFEINPDLIKEKFSQINERLVGFNYSTGNIRKLYKENFTDMNAQLFDSVRKKFFTDRDSLDESDLRLLIQKSKTVNELLHILHSYVTYNKENLRQLPIIDKKEHGPNASITLYGEETELAKKIFEDFPEDLVTGNTEIFGIRNKVIMVVKGRGKELLLDVGKVENQANNFYVTKYFFSGLEGIINASQMREFGKLDENGITGSLDSDEERVIQDLFEFIEKVPLDRGLEPESKKSTKKSKKFSVEEFGNDIAKKKGENGRKISNVGKMLELMRDVSRKLHSKSMEESPKEGEEKGEIGDEKSDRD